jgi:hypothetical protein
MMHSRRRRHTAEELCKLRDALNLKRELTWYLSRTALTWLGTQQWSSGKVGMTGVSYSSHGAMDERDAGKSVLEGDHSLRQALTITITMSTEMAACRSA